MYNTNLLDIKLLTIWFVVAKEKFYFPLKNQPTQYKVHDSKVEFQVEIAYFILYVHKKYYVLLLFCTSQKEGMWYEHRKIVQSK